MNSVDLPLEDDHESFSVGDTADIDWGAVVELQARYDTVEMIDGHADRLAAARRLIAELQGGQ